MNAHWTPLQRPFPLIVALFVVKLSCCAASVPITMPQDARTAVVNAPKPEYPLEARQRHERGSGVFLLRAKIPSGRVTQVIVARTTGYKSLDAAAVKALSKWRFKPGALIHHEVTKPRLTPPISKEECLILLPVTFTL